MYFQIDNEKNYNLPVKTTTNRKTFNKNHKNADGKGLCYFE